MSKNLKKKILITAELASSEVGVFFQELGFELEYTYVKGSNYNFVVDDACPLVRDVPRIQLAESLSAELQPMVFGRINKEMFDSEQGRKLLSSYFYDAVEFDLVDRYSKEMSNIYSIKIHEYLNLGYFVDLIIVEAYKAQFDISALRSYLNTVLSFAFKKVESSVNTMPIDVFYSHNGEAFAIQISLLCDDWKGIPEMDSCINDLTNATNYFDTTYFHKTNRLTLSGLIFKNPELKKAKANFFTEVVRRSADVEITNSHVSNIYCGLVFNKPERYQVSKKITSNPATKLVIARKFAHFIKDYRQRIEDPPIPLGKLIVDDVINYLAHYPNQEELQEIDSEVKHFIYKLLQNKNLSKNVDNFVQVITDSYPHAVVREIQKIMGDKGLDEIESVISGYHLKPEDGFIFKVKSESEEKENSDIQRISGADSNALSDSDIWEIRKSQLNIKDHPHDHSHLSAAEHSANEKWEIKDLNTALSVEAELERIRLETEFSQKFLSQHTSAEKVREKLESQIDRMKKIILQMKKELLKLHAEKAASEEVNKNMKNSDSVDVQVMKSTMDRSLETIKNKDYAIEKMKKDFDQIMKSKDQRIYALEQRVSSMNDQPLVREDSNDEKVEKLENEIKTLNFKLELANKKNDLISEKMGQREKEINAKRDKEVEALKNNLKIVQGVIEELKIEKIKQDAHENEDHEHLKKNKDGKKADDEKDETINVLNADKKALEEKFKAQGIELKKAEQKLKYTLSQLESSNKKKSGGGSNKSFEVYAKQLDQASARMAEATAEVIEKRREIVKAKQENSIMAAKITELEKKLAILDKKVA